MDYPILGTLGNEASGKRGRNVPLLRCKVCDHIVADTALKCLGCGTGNFKGSDGLAPIKSGTIRALKGVNGQVELYKNKFVIRRKG